MAREMIAKGKTGKPLEFTFRSTTDGQPKTGVAYSAVTVKCTRNGASSQTSLSPVSGTLGTYVANGWAEFGTSGQYQFYPDNTNAVFASGVDSVVFTFSASGCITKEMTYQLTSVDLQDATAAGIGRLDASVSSRLAPTTSGRTLDVDSNHKAPATVATGDAADLTSARLGYIDGLATTNARVDVAVSSRGTSTLTTSDIPTASTIAGAVATAILANTSNKLATDGSGRVTVGTNSDKGGYSLSTAANDAIAAAVESAIMNEADGQAVLAAIVAKINAVDTDLSGLSIAAITSAVQSAIERGGGMLALTKAQADKIGTDSGDGPAAQTAQGRVATIHGKLPAGGIGDATEAAATSNKSTLLTAVGSPMQAGAAVALATDQPNYAPAKAGDAMSLTSAYEAAKTAASQSSVAALGSPMQAGSAVSLAATQNLYAPAKAGDAMTLTAGERTASAGVFWSTLNTITLAAGSFGATLKTMLADFANMISDSGTSTPKLTEDAVSNVTVAAGGGASADALASAVWAHDDGAAVSSGVAAIENQIVQAGGVTATVTTPLASDGRIEIVQGDDYRAADGRAIVFTFTGMPSLVGSTVDLVLSSVSDDSTVSVAGSVLSSGTVSFDLAADVTAGLWDGDDAYTYAVRATLANGRKFTPQLGVADVRK
jgi:hypothetical protein